MLNAGATAGAGFVGGGDPFSIARLTMAEDVVFVCLSQSPLPFLQFSKAEIRWGISHKLNE